MLKQGGWENVKKAGFGRAGRKGVRAFIHN